MYGTYIVQGMCSNKQGTASVSGTRNLRDAKTRDLVL